LFQWVYRGTTFVTEALLSIQRQLHKNLDVLISVDGADYDSARVCEPFLSDPRFRMIVQEAQLGWAGNITFLMSQCRGDYWYYHQQDDTVAPEYVQALCRHASAHNAAVIYSDIEAFGALSGQITQRAVTGSPVARQMSLMLDHHSAVAFRGLTRRTALEQAGGVRPNDVDDFSADTVWMASVARAGELHRVARVLYRKRYHEKNVHTSWGTWPLEKRLRAWQVHCRDMFLEGARAEMTRKERYLLLLAAMTRLVSGRTGRNYLSVESWREDTPHMMLEGFIDCLLQQQTEAEDILDCPWAAIESRITGVFLP
jgi:glycosyltransferase involved in cell wall biosynthesis